MNNLNLAPILLVEDNPSDIDLSRRAFEKVNIPNPLIAVEDGEEALEYLFCEGRYQDRKSKLNPALILLDLKMPGIGGMEVLKRIRSDRRTRGLLVVILTSSKEEQDLVMSYSLGVNSYIRKPVDFNEFTEVIKQLGMYWLVLNEAPNLE